MYASRNTTSLTHLTSHCTEHQLRLLHCEWSSLCALFICVVQCAVRQCNVRCVWCTLALLQQSAVHGFTRPHDIVNGTVHPDSTCGPSCTCTIWLSAVALVPELVLAICLSVVMCELLQLSPWHHDEFICLCCVHQILVEGLPAVQFWTFKYGLLDQSGLVFAG